METKINIIGICFFFLLLSCHGMKKNNQTESIPIQQQWNVGLRDTIIKECVGNSFIAYHLQGDSIYSIEWGNNFITNTSKKKFEVLGSGVLGLLEVDENCILLSQSCGTSCVYYVFLPLKMDATEKVYDFVLANDLKKHLIAYIPTDNDTIFIRVENYLTGQIMDVKETNMCQATFKADCIDSIYFNKSSLILKWQGSGWSETKPDPHERTIPVEF